MAAVRIYFSMVNAGNGQYTSGLDLSSAGVVQVSSDGSVYANRVGAAPSDVGGGDYCYTFDNTEVSGFSLVVLKVVLTGYAEIHNDKDLVTAAQVSDITSAVTTINAHTDSAVTTINAHTDSEISTISPAAIANAVLNAMLSDHPTVGSVGDGIAIAAGLLQGNFYMDNTNNTDPNGQTAARIRIWRSAAAMAGVTSGGTGQGEFAIFLVTTSYSGPNQILTHQVTRTL